MDYTNILRMFTRKVMVDDGKIFCIGSSKTGTSSMGHSLGALGLNHLRGGWRVANRLVPLIVDEKWDEFYSKIDEYDSFDDIPFSHGNLYKLFSEKYENSRFILTERPTDIWLRSIERQLTNITEPQTPLEKCEHFHWTGLYWHILEQYGDIRFPEDAEHMMEVYEERNNSIKEFFESSDRLLVLDIAEENNELNAKKLTKFVDTGITLKSLHHVNKYRDREQARKKDKNE